MFKLVALLVLVGLAHSAPSVQNSLMRTLKSKGTADIMVILAGTNEQTLNNIAARTFSDRAERINTVVSTLQVEAERTQGAIRSFIAQEKNDAAVVHEFWITNKIIIRSADLALVQKLQSRSEVVEIRQERAFPLDEPIDFELNPPKPRAGEQWGVVAIGAPSAWAAGHRGQGIVVANIDTGVRGTHEALASNHRANYGWRDPYDNTASPTDNGGHGTHTMGSIAGTANGIGVAPGATWIACKGCGTQSCTEAALLECAEWVACPTNAQGGSPDCSQAPNVVSNSWGGGQGDNWYDDSIRAWRAANIVPLFSQGNSGPYCGSANSPGDSTVAIGVGSTTEAGRVSDFSSVGPTAVGNRIKPDIAAPGSAVYSSYNQNDRSYATMSGTSMACPHSAGLAALILSKNPNHTIEQVQAILQQGTPTTSTNMNCGNINENTYPNHHVGHGQIDATKV